MPSRRTASRRQITCTCEVCGKSFLATRPSKTCVDNSTCRVKLYQQRKAVQRVAKEFMMDMDSYQAYLKLMDRYPTLKEKTDEMIFDLGNEKAAAVIGLMWETMCLESNRRYTPLPD